ncbi:MAG: hypothetical protein M1840_008116 [Geoglossum simile]|nr:MAG: hypothetical protein M1840_008116 [Geoglossum simile]
MPTAASEADVIQNRINVALAKSQRLVASWLPLADPATNTRSVEEIQRQEDTLFTPIPPRLGLGAPIPKEFADGDVKKQKEFVLNDKIRRKMMGGRSSGLLVRPQAQSKKGPSGETASASLSHPNSARGVGVEIDSEGEGRASQWKNKRSGAPSVSEGAGGGRSGGTMALSRERPSASKRRTNYLDEYLLEKSEKKRRGNRKAIADRSA